MLPCNGNVNAMPRKISCKLVINGNTLTDVKSLNYYSGWSGAVSIGKVVSSYFSCTIRTPNYSLAGANVILSMGIGDPVEWVQIGSFKIDEESVRMKQGFATFNAFDKLNKNAINTYHSALTFPTSLQAICNEVCSLIGITSVTLPVNPTISVNILDGYTLRDVLGYIAAYCGCNAYLSPSDSLSLRWFSSSGYTADGTRANIPYIGESDCIINRLICQNSEGVLTSGSGQGMYFMCPFMTQARLDTLRAAFSGFTYRKADVNIPYGSFLLQAGDIITVTTTGSSLTVPIMSNQWSYDGGLSSDVSSFGVSDYSGTANNCERSLSMVRRQYIMNAKHTASQVATAIQEATDTITGALGGVMRINMGQDGKPAELLILSNDIPGLTPTIQNATRVFRLNENGLGFSNNGYGGPYATAITAAGLIVTDRFVGNTISGVTVETTEPGQSSRSKTVIEDGAIEFKRVAAEPDGTIYNIGYLKYVPRGDYDEFDTLAARVDYGKVFAIGYVNGNTTNDEFIYYSDPPSGSGKFNLWGDLKIWSTHVNNMISVQDTLKDLQDQIDDLKQRVSDLE